MNAIIHELVFRDRTGKPYTHLAISRDQYDQFDGLMWVFETADNNSQFLIEWPMSQKDEYGIIVREPDIWNIPYEKVNIAFRELNNYLAIRREYQLQYNEFFDLNYDHLNRARSFVNSVDPLIVRIVLIVSNNIGLKGVLHMYSRAFAESLTGLPRDQLAKILGVVPSLKPEIRTKVMEDIHSGKTSPSFDINTYKL